MTDTREPGAALDAEVAEKVMEWCVHKFTADDLVTEFGFYVCQNCREPYYKPLPIIGRSDWSPSTSIADAIRDVVPELQRRGWTVLISAPHSGNLHSVLILLDHGARSYGPGDIFWKIQQETTRHTVPTKTDPIELGRFVQATEKDLAYTICLAALRAVGAD